MTDSCAANGSKLENLKARNGYIEPASSVPLRPATPSCLKANRMKLKIRGISTNVCNEIWRNGVDANGQRVLVRVARGPANPCRHCLELITEGDDKLVLAHRPFDTLHPYAETGPIFLHTKPCYRYESENLPTWFKYLDPAIVRGYASDDWIRYDTGNIVRGEEITHACQTILSDVSVSYVHVRSKFNCFQCRVDRG